MANEKISEMTEVTTLPDAAVIPAVDLTRAEGDRNVKITKANLQTDLGAAQDLQSVIDEGGYAQSDDANSYVDIDLSDAGAGYIDAYINDGTNAAQVYIDKNNASISATEGTETGSVQVGHDQAYMQRVKDGNKTINFNISEPTNTGQVNITTPTLPVGNYSLSIYGGEWNASTNTPTLANTDTNVKGVWRKVSVAGSHDFGAGSITFGVGDIVDNDGSVYFKRTDNNQSTGGGSGGDVTKIADVTALRAITTAPDDGALYFLVGHTEAYKGGGFIYWDNTSTDADDNLSVYKPTAIATGRFKRIIENKTVNLYEAGGLTNPSDDNTIDASQAYLTCRDWLINNGGGTLVFPPESDRYYITCNLTDLTADYSEITYTSGSSNRAKIYIDGVNANETVVTGRGTLAKVSDGTTNFTAENLDILCAESCLSNGIENGVFCQAPLAGWENLTFRNLKIYTEARLDTQTGSHGITFTRDTDNASDTNLGKNLKVENCDIYLTGNSTYGIHSKRTIEGASIYNNDVELTAFSNDAADAFNAIALYGDGRYWSIDKNRIWSSGHSGIAVSMAEDSFVTNNYVRNVQIVNEAGIEAEYKEGHGTNLTNPDFQTKGIKFDNNIVEDCYWGFAILTREPFSSSSTETDPYDIQCTNLTVRNSENVDVIIASNISGTPDYTQRITNVMLNNITIEGNGTAGGALRVYDATKVMMSNINISGGHTNGIIIGRTSDILPNGTLVIENADISDCTTNSIWFEEGEDLNIVIDKCFMYGGSRGLFMNIDIDPNDKSTLKVTNCHAQDQSIDGFFIKPSTIGAYIAGNTALDCGQQGFDVAITDGVYIGNKSYNCPTADAWTGSDHEDFGNKDLP